MNMESPVEMCSICDKPIFEENPCMPLNDNGFQTLVKSSKRCGDQKFSKVQNADSTNVHKKCTIAYTRERDVEAAEKEL